MLDGEFFIDGINGVRYLFKKGNCYLIPSGFSYRFGCEESMEHIYFHIRLAGDGGTDLLETVKAPIEASIEGTDAELMRLRGLVGSESLTDTLLLECELRGYIGRLIERNSVKLENRVYTAEIRAVLEYISAHPTIGLSIRELSERTRLGQSTLTRRFRKETGLSIGEYIDRAIMLRAEQELLKTDRSILSISEELGFCDQFYFSRKFKDTYGVSPSEYRKRPSF